MKVCSSIKIENKIAHFFIYLFCLLVKKLPAFITLLIFFSMGVADHKPNTNSGIRRDSVRMVKVKLFVAVDLDNLRVTKITFPHE